MKKNLALTYNEKEVKLTKKNYIIIIIPIILILTLIIGIALYVSINNNPSNKMKKYLEEIGYSCNKKICSKEIDGDFYRINYDDLILSVDNDIYRLTISSSTPVLEVLNDEFVCNYTKSDYDWFTTVDNTFIYEKKCEKYIEEVNKHTEKYKSIVNSAGVDVNKLKK